MSALSFLYDYDYDLAGRKESEGGMYQAGNVASSKSHNYWKRVLIFEALPLLSVFHPFHTLYFPEQWWKEEMNRGALKRREI